MKKASYFILTILVLIVVFPTFAKKEQIIRSDDCEIIDKVDENILDKIDWTQILQKEEIKLSWQHTLLYCKNLRSDSTNPWLEFLDSPLIANQLIDIWFRKIDAINYFTSPDPLWQQRRKFIEKQKRNHYLHPLTVHEKFIKWWFGDTYNLQQFQIEKPDQIVWNNNIIAWKYYQVCHEVYDIILPAIKTYNSLSPVNLWQTQCKLLARKRIIAEINFVSNIIIRNIEQTIADITEAYIYAWFMETRMSRLVDKFMIMLWKFELIVKRYNKRTKQCGY